MFYGRNNFQKDWDGVADYVEMDIAVGASGIKAGVWDGEIVSAVFKLGGCGCVCDSGHPGRQTVKGGGCV